MKSDEPHDKIGLTETPPEGNFVSDAKRCSKNPIQLRRNPLDSLWRNVVDSAFLQQAGFETVVAKIYRFRSEKFFFPSQRVYLGIDVCHYHGAPANQQDRDIAIQWSFPGDVGIESVSRSIYLAEVLETTQSQSHSSIGSSSRQSPESIVEFAQTSKQSGVRFGFGCDYGVWKTTRSQNRLQSQETWQAILSSPVLLRSSLARILAWIVESGQHSFHHGSHPFLESLFGKSSYDHRQNSHTISDGFWILQPTSDPIPRREWVWICYCRQGISTPQSQSTAMPIQSFERWLGSRRVLGKSASSLAKTASLCGRATPSPRGSHRVQTIDFLQRQKVFLSSVRYQSENDTLESVSFLSPKSHYRKEQSRVPLRLSFRQNPYRYLDSQCSLLSIITFFCQYRPLVQKALFTQRISHYYTGYHSYRFLSFTCKTGTSTQEEHHQIASRLSLPKRIPRGVQENSETAIAQKISFLQVTRSCTPTRHGLK